MTECSWYVEAGFFSKLEEPQLLGMFWFENSVVGMTTLLTSPPGFPSSAASELFTGPFTGQRMAGALVSGQGLAYVLAGF